MQEGDNRQQESGRDGYSTAQKAARRLLMALLLTLLLLPGYWGMCVIWGRERDRVANSKPVGFAWFLGQYAIVFTVILVIGLAVLAALSIFA